MFLGSLNILPNPLLCRFLSTPVRWCLDDSLYLADNARLDTLLYLSSKFPPVSRVTLFGVSLFTLTVLFLCLAIKINKHT